MANKSILARLVIAGIVLAAPARAEERTWDGSGDMIWSQPDTNSWSGETYSSGDGAKFLGDGAGTISITNTVSPGSVYVDATNDYTFTDGAIGGSGALTKTNSGTLTIVNGFKYGGGSIINGGTLRFEGTDSTIQAIPGNSSSIDNGATWEHSDTGSDNRFTFQGETITFGATGGCTIDFIAGNILHQGGITYVTSGGAKNVIATSGGHMNMQSGSITFDVADGDDDIDLEVSPRVHGNPHQTAGTVIKEGAGVLAMTHTGSAFKDTTVNAGTLLMNGKNTGSGTATVNSGATLGGTGTVASLVSLSSGGHLAPGSLGIGTLTLSDGLTLNDGAVLDMEVDTGSDTNDLITVTGGTITGSDTNGVTVNVILSGNGGGLYTLMDWSAAAESGLDLADFNVAGEGAGVCTLEIADKTLLVTVSRGMVFRVR